MAWVLYSHHIPHYSYYKLSQLSHIDLGFVVGLLEIPEFWICFASLNAFFFWTLIYMMGQISIFFFFLDQVFCML